jgi:predicted RNA-binding protein with PUA-like domain
MAEDLPRPRHWLLKSEPDTYSIDTLEHEGVGRWDGVRNFTARNLLREMKVGELALFYHSSTRVPAVVGVCRVHREAYADPSQHDPKSPYFDPKSNAADPRWSMVEVEYVSHLPRAVTLEEIKADPALAEMVLVKRSRLSVQPVTAAELERIVVEMGGGVLPKAKKTAASKTTVTPRPKKKITKQAAPKAKRKASTLR